MVIAGGTYGSPQILLRSGIGPAADLRALGIDVHMDLPGVGANLRDHPGVEVDTGYEGPGRDAPLLHSIATFHSRTTPSDRSHDLMLWIADPVGPESPAPVTIEAVLLRPEARGRVSLRSADPTDPPRIELPGLTDGDVRRLRKGSSARSPSRHNRPCAASALARRRRCRRATTRSGPSSARTATRSRTSSGRARWGRGPRTAPWSTRTAASTGSRTCSSPTRRSSRSHRPASATSRR